MQLFWEIDWSYAITNNQAFLFRGQRTFHKVKNWILNHMRTSVVKIPCDNSYQCVYQASSTIWHPKSTDKYLPLLLVLKFTQNIALKFSMVLSSKRPMFFAKTCQLLNHYCFLTSRKRSIYCRDSCHLE